MRILLSDIRNSGEFNKSHENGRKDNPVRKQQFAESVTAAPKERKVEKPKKQTLVVKPNKPFGFDSGPGRPIKPTFERKLNNDEMKLLQKSDKGTIRQRHVPNQQNVSI